MMSFEDILAEAMEEPEKVRHKTEISSYPRFLKTELGEIWYQHEEMVIVGTQHRKK